MADAPEVVPAHFTSSTLSSSQSPILPESTLKGVDGIAAVGETLKGVDGIAPVSDTGRVADGFSQTGRRYAREEQQYFPDEKQGLNHEDDTSKTVIPQPENEETNPKIGYAHDDRAGSGMEPSNARTVDAKEVDIGPTTQVEEAPRDDEWHFGFWSSCQPSSLCMESIFCPCVLTGRTHMRLHKPDDIHFSSTNGYCAGCFGLCFLGLGAAPLFCFMTTAQRREVRYRYHIKGDNGDDCIKGTFCVWCSLVQEEKEVVWREEQKKLVSREQMDRRKETMAYSPDGR